MQEPSTSAAMRHLYHEGDREVEEVVILVPSADAGDALRPHSTKHAKTKPAWPQTAAASAPLPPPNASLSLVDNAAPRGWRNHRGCSPRPCMVDVTSGEAHPPGRCEVLLDAPNDAAVRLVVLSPATCTTIKI
jgi:hypothetical protein